MRHRVAAWVFAGLALVLVASVLPNPLRLALGHPDNDVWNHVWGYWWVYDSVTRAELPLHTTLLNWPKGGSLWFIDIFGAVYTLPFQALFGPVFAYNLACLVDFWLCGVGAYVLAWSITRSKEGALLAGIMYMTAPHLIAQAYNGISETLSAGWFPLAIAAVRHMLREATPKAGLLAGAAWATTTIANWYYGLFVGVVSLALAAGERERWREWGVAALAGAGGFAAIAAFPFYCFVGSMAADDAVVTRNPEFVWITLILHNMTDAETLVHPGKFYSPDLVTNFDEHLIVVVYIGWALLIPAVASLGYRVARHAKPWIAMGAFFALMALGPFLYVHGDYLQVAGGWVPLPFLLFFKAFPMFDRIAHAYRFILGVYLGLAIAAAWFVVAVERRWSPIRVVAVLGAARLVESLWLSPAVYPIPASEVAINPVYAEMTGGAVLDLPMGVPVLARAEYGLAQVVHGQPSPSGLNDPTPAYLAYNRYSSYLLELERTTQDILPTTLPMLDLVVGRADLLAEGLRWIVLHKEPYPPAQLQKLERFLDITATPFFEDDELRVYRLDP